MLEPRPKPRTARRRLVIEILVGVGLLGLALATGWYLRSPAFDGWVRGRVAARMQQVTGGRVELRSLTWNLFKLEFEARDLTIHGLEKPGDIPYLHVDRLRARATVFSLVRRQIGLRELELDRPVMHLIVYPDGTTNQPPPATARNDSESAVQDLFDIRLHHASIRDGLLLLNDRPLPLDLQADHIALTASLFRHERRYDADLHIGSMRTSRTGWGPFSASAAARISLWQNHLRVDSLELSSGRSHLQASGELRDFHKPAIYLKYRAGLELGELAPALRVPELRSGMLEISGQGTAATPSLFASGKLSVRNFTYLGSNLSLSRVSGGSDFTLTRRKLLLPHILANLLGGTAIGDAEIGVGVAGTPASKPGAESAGVFHLKLRGLSVRQVAAAVSTRSLPLDQMNTVGSADASITGGWKRSPRDLVATIVAKATPPANFGRTDLPVQANLEGTYDHLAQALKLQSFEMQTRATRLTAVGVLGRRTGGLRATVDTEDLGEWKPVLAALGHAGSLPVEVHGRASFRGTVTGSLAAPRIVGRLQVYDFDSLLAARREGPALGHSTSSNRVHWDSLVSDIEYSPTAARAQNSVLKHGSADIKFNLAAGLQSGRFNQNSPFSVRAHIHNGEIGDLLPLAGYDYPISGNLNATLQISGSGADPQGTGNVVITNARFYDQPIQHFSAGLEFAHRQAKLTDINVVQDTATLRGKAGYSFQSGWYSFDLRGVDISLGRIRQLQTSRAVVSGRLDFVASGQGTKEQPAINADLHLRDMIINGERFGGLNATAVTLGDRLQFKGQSASEHADLEVNGNAQLRGDFPARFECRINHLDVDPVIRMFLKEKITGHSALAGTLTADGPLRSPLDLRVAANLNQFSADIEHVQLRNEGPIRFAIAQRALQLQQLRVAGRDTALEATGTLQLAGSRKLDLGAKGHVNLELLSSMDPSLVAYGWLTLDLRVGGTMARPLLDGQLDVNNAGLSHVELPNGLSDLNGRMVFSEDRLRIQNLTAKSGGGTLNIGGFVTYGRTPEFNLTARGHDVRLRYPPGLSAAADADLRLTGGMQNALLAGDITVTRFGVNPEFDFAAYLAKAKQPGTVASPSSPLSRMRLDVHILSTPELQVQTSLAKISGDVDVRVRGTPARPVLLGRANIIEGDIYFNSTKYHLERGDVTFTNPVTIEPVLDLEATTTVRDYDITLGFHGPMEKLSTTYRSDPPLATADIVSLLAFGRTREETAMQSSQTMGNLTPETQTILYQALNAAVSSRVQKLFGVSRIKIDPQAGGAENSSAGPRLTIEQQVANNLTLTYITDVGRTNYQTIQAEYNINRNVSVVAVRDWNGVVSFDVRIRQRKR